MKSERQERPDDGVASESETRLWEALSRASQAIHTSDQVEVTGNGAGERSRVDREVLCAALGTDAPLGRVGH